MKQQTVLSGERQLGIILVGLLLVIVALKLFLATRLELYSDEIFYWFAATRPALAYSDLPFMAALLAGTGANLFGEQALGVRSIFLIMGSSLPLLIYWLARPLVSRQQALAAALLSLCLPLGALLGLLAVPDVPLVFFGVLMIGLAERATRLDAAPLWLALGLITALGLSTHYRFVLFPVALLGFLLVSRTHHYLWRTARLWVAAGIAACGLLPVLLFNLQHDLSGLDYHLLDRHPWEFQAEGLAHPLIQSLVVTPLLYLLLLATLLRALQQARRGEHRSGLLASFAIAHLAIYLLTAPWADTTRTTLHWPLPGYLPLLVLAPDMLQRVRHTLGKRLGAAHARRLVLLVPVSALLGGILTFAGIGSQGFNEQLQDLVGQGVLSNKMAGWQPLNTHLRDSWSSHLDENDENRLIVTDNYYTAAQIAFHSGRRHGLYTLDEDKSVRDGRRQQLALWNMDAAALQARTEPLQALFITEDSTLNVDEKKVVLQSACTLFDNMDYAEQLFLLNGEKTFSLYQASTGVDSQKIALCPRPAMAWLDQPAAGEQLSGTITVSGWAYQLGEGIAELRLLVAREPVLQLQRDQIRADVVAMRQADSDPDSPLLGFSAELDSRQLPEGTALWQLEVINRHGEQQHFPPRRITIRHH